MKVKLPCGTDLVSGVGAIGSMAFKGEVIFWVLGVNVLNGDSAFDASQREARRLVFLVVENGDASMLIL